MKSFNGDNNANSYDILPIVAVMVVFGLAYLALTFAVNPLIDVNNDHVNNDEISERSAESFSYARDAWYILPVIFLICVGLWVHFRSGQRTDIGEE